MILLTLALATGQIYACDVSRVVDGDTWACADGLRVRARAIDAPDYRCRRGRVCAPGDPAASHRNLERMIAGRTLACEHTGYDRYRRSVAWCKVGGVDLSCAQYRAGMAIRVAAYDKGKRLCRR
jgi:micrococcal nuclease